MAVADIIFLVIIALSSIMGVFRGLIREALSLVTWVGAIVVGSLLYDPMASLLTGVIDNTSLRNLSAFAILFVLTILVGTIIGNLLQKLIQAAGLGGVDRILGCIFGVLRGLIIISLVLLLTLSFDFTASWYDGSFLVPYLMVVVDFLKGVFQGGDLSIPVDAGIVADLSRQLSTTFFRS